ncbi:MAG TPA: nuclear transport factor 2 family protein, partial [Actinomycetes bacterium]
MPVDRDSVAAWLAAYVDAWRSYDAAAIGELFSRDATYRYHPWDEPVRGRAAIVADWRADQDPPGSWEAAYEPLAVDGDVA